MNSYPQLCINYLENDISRLFNEYKYYIIVFGKDSKYCIPWAVGNTYYYQFLIKLSNMSPFKINAPSSYLYS